MSKLDDLYKRVSPEVADRQRVANAIQSGNEGNLIIGEIIHKRLSDGRDTDTLEAWLSTKGLRLPSKPTRTKYMKAYEAWVVNAGLTLTGTYQHPDYTDDSGAEIGMTLKGVSTYALYEARNLINRQDPAETLAFIYTHEVDEIRDAARDRNQDREPDEGVRSLKLQKPIMDELKELEATMFAGISRSDIVSFLIMFIRDLNAQNPDTFKQALAAYFGDDE